MLNTNYGNYVKFLRGSETAWEKLDNSLKSSDTLYFISNSGDDFGKLYLGSKLIANGGLSSATSLEALNNVKLENVTDQSILVFNNSTGMWENKSILDLPTISVNVFKGASEQEDGTSGLVPAPKQNEQNLFLRGDGLWSNPVEEVAGDISALQGTITTLVGADSGKSIREIASLEASEAVATIVNDAPEQFDTLKEIATWIQENQDVADVSGLVSRVNTLEETIFGIPADETTGSAEVPGLQAIVSNLQQQLSELNETVESNSSRIETLEKSMRWEELQ